MITDERKQLCEHIRLYHQVKRKWNLGHVKCLPFKCYICNRMKWYANEIVFKTTMFHERVIGCYGNRRVLLCNS